jgi:exosortase
MPRNILEIRERPAEQHACFLLFVALSLIVLWVPLSTLLTLSLQDERYSHILIVPVISLVFAYLERRKVFGGLHFSPLQSAPFFLAGVIAYGLSRSAFLIQNDRLSLMVCALIAILMAGFMLFYGAHCFHAALFPLLFLVLMIPMPVVAIDKIIFLLQKGSTVVAYGLFRAFGVPVFWSGFTFALPGVEIEVAKECSGIRSTISLLITGIVAGHIFLTSGWRKILLCILTLPIAIFKNAVRIVTISSLGVYVDKSFLFGKLHRYGGVPFSLIALTLLAAALFMLRRREAKSRGSMAGEMRPVKFARTPA